MIDLRGSRFTDIMPENLASQLETQAFAYALGRQIEKLCAYADSIRVYADVSTAPENVLDFLAVELRTPAYSQEFSIEAKRALVAGTLQFYAHLGTPAAVEEIIHHIFKGGKVSEWFEYGGNPHHFRVDITLQGETVAPRTGTELRRMINGIKRLSSWLDEIRYFIYPEKAVTRAGGAFLGIRHERRIPIQSPSLSPPGGRGQAHAWGALGGTHRRIVATAKPAGVQRPGGQGGTGCAAGVVSTYQRFTVKINERKEQ